jgi:hypothetical protein
MNNLKKNAFWLATFVAGFGLITMPARAQYIGPEAGQKVTFIGDTITAFATRGPSGYPALIASALEQQGKKIVMNLGVDDFNSSDVILKNMGVSPLAKNTDWVILSCGGKEAHAVWDGEFGPHDFDMYKQNMTSIVDLLTASGSKVVILTATMIGEDPNNAKNQGLAPFNDFVRALAAQKHLLLADINAEMQTALAETKTKNPKLKGDLLTEDNVPWNGVKNGVFLNSLGNELVATGVLKTFGFTEAQLAQATELWQSQPGGALVTVNSAITVRQYLQLRSKAADQGYNNQEILSLMLPKDMAKNVQDHLSAPAKP